MAAQACAVHPSKLGPASAPRPASCAAHGLNCAAQPAAGPGAAGACRRVVGPPCSITHLAPLQEPQLLYCRPHRQIQQRKWRRPGSSRGKSSRAREPRLQQLLRQLRRSQPPQPRSASSEQGAGQPASPAAGERMGARSSSCQPTQPPACIAAEAGSRAAPSRHLLAQAAAAVTSQGEPWRSQQATLAAAAQCHRGTGGSARCRHAVHDARSHAGASAGAGSTL
jgi:hypothetical protein